MATDRHQAPSYPLRMPEDLKSRAQEAAEASGRSLHAELLHRLQHSFATDKDVPATNLMLTVVRLERDAAKLEVEKSLETLTIQVIASTLRCLLDDQDEKQELAGILANLTVKDWKWLCDAYIAKKAVYRPELAKDFERLKHAEAKVQSTAPAATDPLWEEIKNLRSHAGNMFLFFDENVLAATSDLPKDVRSKPQT